MKSRRFFKTVTFLVLSVACLSLGTPLDDYVAAPDASYRYDVVKTVKGPGYTAYIIDMVSQTWRTKAEVDKPVWQHWLTIIRPDGAKADTALLWINGGSTGRPAPEDADKMLAGVALAANAVVADLRTVPNEPLVFADDPNNRRSEDAIIAYSYVKCLQTGDTTWPLLLPMAKSAVRAMDTVQKHLSSLDAGPMQITKFVVSGGSKRGWTTWLTAAVDKRVVAIAPAVIDVLNMDEQMKHHFAAYGFYSQAIGDYQQLNVFDKLFTPEGQGLIKIVDPYEYRDRYAGIPKFLVNSSGDQFFLPDSAQFYFHDLPGEKHLRYVPNTDHSLGGSDAVQSLVAFYQSILAGRPRPQLSWAVKPDSSIEVQTASKPLAVKLWQATNPKARDFRKEIIGPVWKDSPLEQQGGGKYVAKVPQPDQGWTAFFVELTFDSGGPLPHKFTTAVHVVPDTLPFAK